MERTRSGRTVKRSSKFLEMEDEYEDDPTVGSEDEDGDFNAEDDNNSEDESFEEENINYRSDNLPRISQLGRTRRPTFSKGTSQELIWKDGKLVIASNPEPQITHQIIEKRRPNPKILFESVPATLVIKDEPGSIFYSHIFESLNKKFIYPNFTNIPMDRSHFNLPPLDLLNDDQFRLKLDTKNPSLITKPIKTNDKIKDSMGLGVDMEELERYTRVTGYILYNIVSKKKSESQLHDSQSYRKIQETWTTMPDRTKRDWEIKAKQLKKQIDNRRRNEIIEKSSKKEKRRVALKKAEENLKKARLQDHNMVDLACYLKTVGEGMTKLSAQIAAYQGPVGIPGVESVLMDYLMCSIVPLIGIFEGSEGLDRHITADTLNKLTFLMPGFH